MLFFFTKEITFFGWCNFKNFLSDLNNNKDPKPFP